MNSWLVALVVPSTRSHAKKTWCFTTKKAPQLQPEKNQTKMSHPLKFIHSRRIVLLEMAGLVAQYFDERNPAVMKGLETLIKAAKAKGKLLGFEGSFFLRGRGRWFWLGGRRWSEDKGAGWSRFKLWTCMFYWLYDSELFDYTVYIYTYIYALWVYQLIK